MEFAYAGGGLGKGGTGVTLYVGLWEDPTKYRGEATENR